MRTLWSVTLATFTACGTSPGTSATEGSLAASVTVSAIAWSAAPWSGDAAVVLDRNDLVIVCAQDKTSVFLGSALFAQIADLKGCRGAALVEPWRGAGTWSLFVSSDGNLVRVLDGGTTEIVSDRFGLAGKNVHTLGIPANGFLAFAYDGGIAISNGYNVTTYDVGNTTAFAAGGHRVAYTIDGRVYVRDIETLAGSTFDLPGVDHLAIDETGAVVASVARAVYRDNGGTLELVRELSAPVKSIAASGSAIWITAPSDLGRIFGGQLALTKGANLTEGSRAYGSSSGDVWVADGKNLVRYRVADDGDPARVAWERDMQPIYGSICSACHAPGGSGQLVLSNYDAWVYKRKRIKERIVVALTMPPAGTTMSEENRTKIAGWLTLVGE